MAATRSHFQTLPLLVILYCVLLCDCSSRGRYSSSSGTPSQSQTRYSGDAALEPQAAEERVRGRVLYSSVLEQSTIPDNTVRKRLTDINADSTTHLHNFEISNVQVGDSARFTPIDDVTAELVTSDLSWTINADFEVALTSFWLSWDDEGTISYRVEPSTLNIVYDRHGGPNGEFRQRSCVGDFVLSTPSVTAHNGDSGLYAIILNDIEDDVRRDLTTEICKLFDPAENSVAARQLDSFKEVFQRTCPPITHGIFTDCPFTLNSACAVSCEEGYTTGPSLTPDATIVCTRRGEWNVPAESVCVVASCDNSPDACTEEGETCIDKTPSGFRCQCDDGYIRNSDDTACIAESCDNSPDACTEEGETCIDQIPSGFRCQCDDGYIRNSDDTACIVPEETLVFITRPTDVTVQEGDVAMLPCEVNDDEASRFWFKDSRQLLSDEIEASIYVTSAHLFFLNIEPKHTGNYTCVARSPRGQEIRASALLDVVSHRTTTSTAVADLVFLRPPEDTELTLGDLAILHCEVDAVEAEVNWYKDDSRIREGGSLGIIFLRDNSLVIADVEIHHQGTYRCSVTTGDGRVGESSARAFFPADYVFDESPSDGTVFDGENYHLTCSSRIPTLELSWFKDGSALVYNERIFKLGDDVLLRDVTPEDSGLYACVASDEQGAVIAEASSRLDVLSHNLNDDECGIVTSSEVIDVENRRGHQSGRVVGGRDAKRGSAPWMARLFVNGPRGRRHICGGSLVDRQWVVTAAHCFHVRDDLRPEHLFIRLGDHDTLIDDPPEIALRVEAFYEHEDFNVETYENDIALIKLVTPLTRYSDYIRPICLANRTIDKALLPAGTRGRVNGWGATFEGGVESVYLQEVFLPFVKYKECKKIFREMGYRFTKSMFCAGYKRGGADACQGDSGGPYSNKKDDRWYLTGIVSWGVGCGRPGSNGVYTRYSKYHEWLQNIINDS